MAGKAMVKLDPRAMDRLLHNMHLLPKAVQGKRIDEALWAAAAPVEEVAKLYAPIGERGLLELSIDTELKWEDGERVAWVGPDYKISAVGHLVEFGHKMYHGKPGSQDRALLAGGRKTRKQPFMRPAFDIAGPEGARRMGKKMGKAVERQARRG